ncbi:MAG: hypothetical protein ACLQIB_22985 [Isosphaeraceae bacterium]
MKKHPHGRGGGLAVYVTSHGFGHLHRTAAVLNRVPDEVPVLIRSGPDLFAHWRERLRRPAELEPYFWDAGAVNPPGDSTATDGAATLELAAKAHSGAMAHADEEARFLEKREIAAVLCDAPAVPLVAASRAEIPGFLMANFTWADIYAPHARSLGGDALRLVAELRRAYRHATGVFRIEPALRMSWLSPQKTVGMVVNRGRDRRAELRRKLGLAKTARLVYIYIGRYGQSDLGWSRLERFADLGVHFLSYHPTPGPQPANLHVVPSAEWPGGDLIASSDAILAKAGYGTVTEAMACGTPMIYSPRRGFAEYRVLDRALRTWGGGVPLSSREFRAMRLENALKSAFRLAPGPPPFPPDGAARIAEHLAALCRPSTGRRAYVSA